MSRVICRRHAHVPFSLSIPTKPCGPVPLQVAVSHGTLPPTSGTPRKSARFEATEIVPGLFLGAYSDAWSEEELQSKHITHILNAADECPTRVKNIVTKELHLKDDSDEDISSTFDESTQFIHDALNGGGRVLVHCRMGVSRSAAIVLAYLMRYGPTNTVSGYPSSSESQAPSTVVSPGDSSGMTYSDAFDLVKSARPQVSPNLGFVLALHELELSRPQTVI